MKERPILFSAPMVRALLDGAKTQTRRVVKDNEGPNLASELQEQRELLGKPYCPYGQPGDRLWVREAWHASRKYDDLPPREIPNTATVEYDADDYRGLNGRFRPSMFMPRWASRILLEITGVRIERLQEISEADAIAEGVTRHMRIDLGWAAEESEESFNARQARSTFGLLWNDINGPDSWSANPWVWVVEFKRVTP